MCVCPINTFVSLFVPSTRIFVSFTILTRLSDSSTYSILSLHLSVCLSNLYNWLSIVQSIYLHVCWSHQHICHSGCTINTFQSSQCNPTNNVTWHRIMLQNVQFFVVTIIPGHKWPGQTEMPKLTVQSITLQIIQFTLQSCPGMSKVLMPRQDLNKNKLQI